MTSSSIIASIQFPAIQYFDPPPKPRRAVVQTIVRNWEELAVRGKQHNWPLKRFWVPGGLLDSAGQHFIFTDIRNIKPKPWWLKPISPFFGWVWYSGVFEADLVIEGPEKLSLGDFKKRLAKLVGRERQIYSGQGVGSRKYQSLVLSAQSYQEAIHALWGDFAFEKGEHPGKFPMNKSIAPVEKRKSKK